MRLIAATTVLSFGVLLAACAGGEPAADAGSPSNAAGAAPAASATDPAKPPAQAASPATPAPAPGTGSTPATAAPPALATAGVGAALPYPSDLAAHAGLRVDCQQDSECAVKDVGNCCGRYDACVRADAEPDTAAVQAECAGQGLVGICGFPVIEACVCTAGSCQAAPSDGTGTDQASK